MNMEILKLKFLGSMVGTAVGDALGMPVEGLTVEQVKFRFGKVKDMFSGRLPAGFYTDDTEMMIGVAESLIENKGFNGENMAKKFIQNLNPLRGYGWGPLQVLNWIREGLAWDEAGKKLYGGEGSYGNGGAMRIAPVGLFYYDNPEKLRLVAYNTTKITHTHKLGLEGAIVQAYAVALAVNLNPEKSFDPKNFLQKIYDFTQDRIYQEKIKLVKLLLEKDADISEVVLKLGNGIEAFNSVPTAIYSFLLNYGSFEDSVVYAVNLGGDTDTLGAMTGAIAGAYHGIKKIPKRWLDKLENKDYIKSLAEKLWMIKCQFQK